MFFAPQLWYQTAGCVDLTCPFCLPVSCQMFPVEKHLNEGTIFSSDFRWNQMCRSVDTSLYFVVDAGHEFTHHTRQVIRVIFLMCRVFTRSKTLCCTRVVVFSFVCKKYRQKIRNKFLITDECQCSSKCTDTVRAEHTSVVSSKMISGASTLFILATFLSMASASATLPWESSHRGDSGTNLFI